MKSDNRKPDEAVGSLTSDVRVYYTIHWHTHCLNYPTCTVASRGGERQMSFDIIGNRPSS